MSVAVTVTFWQRATGGGSNTVIVKLCGALVSTPPFAVPPSSCSRTVTFATPIWLGASVKVNVPLGATAGCTENGAVLSLVTMKFSACPLHSAGRR